MYKRQVTTYIGLNVLGKAFPFIFLPAIATALGAEDFAQYGTLLAYGAFLAFFCSFSFDTGLNYFFEIDKAGNVSRVASLVFIMLGLCLTFAIFFPLLCLMLTKTSVLEAAYLTTVALFATWMSLWDRFLRILGELRLYVYSVVARNVVLYLPVGYSLLNNTLDYQNFLSIISVQAIIFSAAAIWYFFRKYDIKYTAEGAREIWFYTRPMIPNKIVSFSIQPLIIFTVNQIYSPAAVAVFIFAQTLGNGLNILTQAILNALNPLVFKASTEGTLAFETIRVIGTSIFYGFACILIILWCEAPLYAYVPNEFHDVVPLFPYFVVYSWANFGKNIILTYVMIKADKVRFVPVSTYIFIITAGLLIHSGRSGSALTMVVGALIVARLVSSIWLFMVSEKKRLTAPLLAINYIGSAVMMLQVLS